jgi:hypothetical protein
MSATSSSKAVIAVAIFVLLSSGITISEAFLLPRINNIHSVWCRPALLKEKVPSVRLFTEPHQEGSSSSSTSSRSIGDVVQGLHGSKYQFSDSGINFEGQQFAETGYGSSTPAEQEEDCSDEPVPTWALKLKEIIPSNESPTLQLASGYGSVQIQNEERSWEKYYAFLIGDNIDTLVVEPSVGMLAPRGGTENFPDTAQLTVQGATDGAGGNAFLAVGTEAEKWVYKII